MFEKTHPVSASVSAFAGGLRPEDSLRAHRAPLGDRFDLRPARRAGDALRAVEWTEITARLNAARDLRLLLRNESLAPIEGEAASFGDAAASYFALLDNSEPGVNPDGLEQSKALGRTTVSDAVNTPVLATEYEADAVRGDARDMQ